jgi:hypothetical protein
MCTFCGSVAAECANAATKGRVEIIIEWLTLYDCRLLLQYSDEQDFVFLLAGQRIASVTDADFGCPATA